MLGPIGGPGYDPGMELGLLLLRVVAGLTLAAHGSQKLFGAFGGGGTQGTARAFEDRLGFRPGLLFALMAGVGELGAGLFLVLGLLTPLASSVGVGLMAVAGWTGHRKAGFFLTKGGWEYTFVLGAVSAVPAFTGPGRWSADNALELDWSGTVAGVLAVAVGLMLAAVVGGSAGRERLEDPLDPSMDEPDEQTVGEQTVDDDGAVRPRVVIGPADIDLTRAGSFGEAPLATPAEQPEG